MHILAAVALYFLYRELFTKPTKEDPQHSSKIDRLLLIFLALFALMFMSDSVRSWLPHPIAGMLLGLLGTGALQVGWVTQTRRLLVGLGASVMLILGTSASWMFIPLVIMSLIWLVQYARYYRASPDVPLDLVDDFSDQYGQFPEDIAADNAAHAALPQARTPLRPFPEPTPKEAPAYADPSTSRNSSSRGKASHANNSRNQSAATPPTWEQSQEPTQVQERAHGLRAFITNTRLPLWLRDKVRKLDEETAAALYYLDANNNPIGERPLNETLYLVRAIRDDYAPEALEAFLRLPSPQSHSVPIEGKKTAADLLGEQLDMMLASTQKTMISSLKEESDRLKSHGRFLRDKLQQSKSDLELD